MTSNKAQEAWKRINDIKKVEKIIDVINQKAIINPKNDGLPIEFGVSEASTNQRLTFLEQETSIKMPYLTGKKKFNDLILLEGNIENYIGMTIIPTGVIGPIRVVGTVANGDYFIPLATSEGALVASYHRGAKACLLAGGVTSVCLMETVQRSPLFKFNSITELGTFLSWVFNQMEQFNKITAENSNYAKFNEMKVNIEGNHLILTFDYYTGDASGQNMVTICTDAICKYIIENCPVQPQHWFLESNYSGDKKATAQSFISTRGKKVTTEVVLPQIIVEKVLKTNVDAMVTYWQSSTLGIIQSGAIGAHGHYANGLAALFLATGQDVACVAEAATGITRMEKQKDGSLYASVTMPNLIVGTVGGGTSLPSQRECLELMECYGPGNARKYAEICGGLILAGELSIAAALSAGQFSDAHKKFGRKKSK